MNFKLWTKILFFKYHFHLAPLEFPKGSLVIFSTLDTYFFFQKLKIRQGTKSRCPKWNETYGNSSGHKIGNLKNVRIFLPNLPFLPN